MNSAVRHTLLAALLLSVAPGLVLAQASKRKSAGPGSGKDEIRSYRLTMGNLERAASVSDDFRKAIAADPSFKSRLYAAFRERGSIDQQAANVDANFQDIAATIHNNGLATRDFILTRMALVLDFYAVASKKQDPTSVPSDAILPENEALILRNYDAVSRMAMRIDLDGGD